MGTFYTREGYGEGDNTWRKNAKFLKELFGFSNEKWTWFYNEKELKWKLEPNEIKLLMRSVNALPNNCTGPVRKPIAGLLRLGPFYHICLWFPVEHGDHRFRYERDFIQKYKDIVEEILPALFPEYQIGYYFRIAYQACYGNYPEMHVHIALSKIRYRKDDKGKTFDSLNPCHSLYSHIDPIMLSNEQMENLIEPIWQTAIKNATGRKVTSKTSLVTVKGKDRQTILDRHDNLRYIANQHLQTFRNVTSLSLANDGKVVIKFKPRNGTIPKPLILSQSKFVRRYMIMPMQTFGIQFRGRGFLCGNAAFAKIGNTAAKLVLNRPRKKNKPRKFFYDLSVENICKRAMSVRQSLDAGDIEGFRNITTKYRLEDPLQELQKLKEIRQQRRTKERAERRLQFKK